MPDLRSELRDEPTASHFSMAIFMNFWLALGTVASENKL